jgi:hypothetical protein
MKHKTLLFFFTFLILSPTLLGKTILWDDLYVMSAWERNDPQFLVTYFGKLGMPWQGWLHYILSGIPNPVFIYKLLSVCSWSASAVLTYILLRRVKSFTDQDRFYIALIAALFPGYNLWFSIIQMPQPLYVAVFLAGVLCYLNGTDEKKHIKKYLGLLLIIPTFALQSLYVFLYGLMAICFWHTRNRKISLSLNALRFFKQHWLLFIFPLVQFTLLKIYFQIDPLFGAYNAMDFKKVVLRVLMSFSLPLYNISNEILAFFSQDILLAMTLTVVAMAIGVYVIRRSGIPPKANDSERGLWLQVMGAGLFLALCAVFPYALVSKPWLGTGYTGRFAMLLSWPLALLFYAFLKYNRQSRMRLRRMLTVAVILIFSFLVLKDQILWQTRYIKYLSLARQLETREPEVESLVFFEDESTVGKPARLIYFELNWIMNRAWGNSNHFGFSGTSMRSSNRFEELDQMYFRERLSDPFFQELMLFSANSISEHSGSASLVTVSDQSFKSNLLLWINWNFNYDKSNEYILANLVKIKVDQVKRY